MDKKKFRILFWQVVQNETGTEFVGQVWEPQKDQVVRLIGNGDKDPNIVLDLLQSTQPEDTPLKAQSSAWELMDDISDLGDNVLG